jgi:hypothetical protein
MIKIFIMKNIKWYGKMAKILTLYKENKKKHNSLFKKKSTLYVK